MTIERHHPYGDMTKYVHLLVVAGRGSGKTAIMDQPI